MENKTIVAIAICFLVFVAAFAYMFGQTRDVRISNGHCVKIGQEESGQSRDIFKCDDGISIF